MSSQDYYNKKLANQYTDYVVKEPCELLQFLMTYVPGNTRTKAKQLLSQKMVYVDKVITTQFNAPLQPGQLVQIAKKGNLHVSVAVKLAKTDGNKAKNRHNAAQAPNEM